MNLDLQLHPETQALVAFLAVVPLGQEVTYADMAAEIGRDIPAVRTRLASARRVLIRDHGAAFAIVRGVGLRRLHPEDAPDLGAASRRKIGRAARRSRAHMQKLAASGNGLPPEAGRKLAAEMATAGLIAHITADKASGGLVDADAPNPHQAPAVTAQRLIDHLRGGKGQA